MNDKGHITTKGDAGLRHAIARREAQLPKMPDTLNDMVMERVARTCRRRRILSLACGAAASVAIIAMLGVAKWTSTSSENRNAIAEVPTATEPNSTLLATPTTGTSSISATSSISTTHGHTAKVTKTEKTKAKETQAKETKADIMSTYQRQVSDYIAMLAQTYHAEAIPLDCRNEGNSTVYVFDDDEEADVFQKLSMIAMWIDTDRPEVRISFDESQMTLELNGSSQPGGTDQLWLADRRNGRIYLYRSQSDTDAWQQSTCYTAFVGQEDRKTEN